MLFWLEIVRLMLAARVTKSETRRHWMQLVLRKDGQIDVSSLLVLVCFVSSLLRDIIYKEGVEISVGRVCSLVCSEGKYEIRENENLFCFVKKKKSKEKCGGIYQMKWMECVCFCWLIFFSHLKKINSSSSP